MTGGVLVVAGLLVPAQVASAAPTGDGALGVPTGTSGTSGLTDLLTVTPMIEGSGSVTNASGYLCQIAGDAGVPQLCSNSIDLGGLLQPSTANLVATPASGWQFDQWLDCPSTPVANTCTVDTSLLTGVLGTTLTPIAKFLPSLGGGLTPPDTTITDTPPVDAKGNTTATTATFGFAVAADTSNPSFECQLTGPGHGTGFTPCGTGSSSTKTYQDLAPGDYTFGVRALAGTLIDQSPAQFAWTVAPAAPGTRLRGGPRQNGWLLAGHVAFRLHSDQPGTTYDCTVDGTTQPCADRLVVRHLAAGTHTVTAAATAGGQTDATPARRTFTRPVNDRALGHSRGWRLHHRRGYFLRSYSQAHRHGAMLRIRAEQIRRIALVAATGHRFGVVEVYLGRHLLKRVPLRARRLHRERVIPVARFRRARRGTVRVVVVSHGRVVRIEGLGIASQ